MKIQPLINFEGNITSSPSKSYSHRAFFFALMAKTPSYIINPLISGDLEVTINFCKSLGAKIEKIEKSRVKDEKIIADISDTDSIYEIVPPLSLKTPIEFLEGKNSGTSIRMLTALTPLISGHITMSGRFFNLKRPLKPLLEALSPLDISWEDLDKNFGIKIDTRYSNATEFKIQGNISSQFISGLLLLAPNLKSTPSYPNSIINLTTPTISTPYLKITEDIMDKFGISFQLDSNSENLMRYTIPADQKYKGKKIKIPGDYSSAAFIIAAAALNPFPNEVKISKLDSKSKQGDKMLIKILQKMNANIEVDEKSKIVVIKGGKFLDGVKIDCKEIPDLFPILCVIGLFANNNTILYNLNHVRTKESDRVSIMIRELQKMGAIIELIEDNNAIVIEGPQQIQGIRINHEDDHRIAMALTIAALYARSETTIVNPKIANDSYPDFFKDLKYLGAEISD
ncbi:3-phosphoshikimate 1-carboxyvinyltransferase [Promethearchaeum syntrophicum]|uniref:3-phosphoshikimate 1-carboxyvinyltransferase n=1 Tax=Promethearchaeum syntrophicum TaxID=2594042 RepID=A0A5B9D924_9ARCH|nr:3-phosphoshikimate 1-carboxyvinyltransferase [Candidatus Prometheoarchaeum syntrophicum]QEE15778.1 3-phosphoshikimate 1-carboxyvinyltransferase [Candidatus Prometheoarchaeum syntrophicum]